MRRPITLLSLLLVLTMVAAACGETKDTGFPPAPKAAAEEDDGHGGGGGGGGDEFEAEPQTGPDTELTIKALNIAFNRDEMLFVADTEITLTFDNLDASVPHNVAIYPDRSSVTKEEALFLGEIFPGVEEVDYSIPPIPTGEYFFQCDVHPNMAGTAVFS